MPPNTNVTTTTNQYLAPRWYDDVLRDNRFFAEIIKQKKRWDGSQALYPMKYQKGVSSVAFNGFDVLPITQQPTTVNMTFYPTFIATNVALSGSDLSQNMTDMQTLKLLDITMKSRAQDSADDIGNFLQGDGTSFGGKAPNGLLNTVDNGTVAATYGGLPRATYSGLNSTVTASGGTISLLKVRQLWNGIADGPVRPDVIITDYNTWSLFEQLLTPFQRNTMTQADLKDGTVSSSGYADIYWDGLKIFRDKKITSGYFYELNMKYLEWYSLKWWEGTSVSSLSEKIQGNVYEDKMYSPSPFTWTGIIRAYNMLAINGYMIFGGQLICPAPLRQGVLTGVTGI